MAEIQDSPEQMTHSGVAARLRAAREQAGFSRPDVAARTKIPERHLISLEAGDFNAVGGRAYAIGFTRSYARAVGLDEAEITSELRAELGASESDDDRRQPTKFEPGDPSRIPGRGTAWIAALGAVAVIVAGITLWRNYSAPPVTLPSLVEEEAAPAVATQEAPPTAAAQPGVQEPVVFTALEEGVWVKFYDAQGNQLMQKLMAKGEAYTIPAEAQGPLIWTARPDALQVSVGGRALAPLADKQVTIKDVPVSAAALLARGTASSPPASVAPSAVPTASPQAMNEDASRVVTAAPLPTFAPQASTVSR